MESVVVVLYDPELLSWYSGSAVMAAVISVLDKSFFFKEFVFTFGCWFTWFNKFQVETKSISLNYEKFITKKTFCMSRICKAEIMYDKKMWKQRMLKEKKCAKFLWNNWEEWESFFRKVRDKKISNLWYNVSGRKLSFFATSDATAYGKTNGND